jgi:GDPmannose 4,6-dehydratase
MSESTSQSVSKVALITGVLGQDGFYLCELLRSKGYSVVGTTHRDVSPDQVSLLSGVRLVKLDLSDALNIEHVLLDVLPDEIYHLASRASSSQLFDDPWAIADINALATLRILEVMRKSLPFARYCQAGSSEVFAVVSSSPQHELSPMHPANAYGAAKAYARHIAGAYREQFGLKACTAILFNHESPRRGLQYVTRKISYAVAAISMGRQQAVTLGNLDNRRDWGHSVDIVRGMWLMLQIDQPEDFVLATGQTHSIREFCETAFSYVGLDYRLHVRSTQDPDRRVELTELRGDTGRAGRLLGWKPQISFKKMVYEMVDADIDLLKNHGEIDS